MPKFPTPDLAEHQEIARKFIKDHKACGIFMDMGSGKTLAALEAFTELYREGKAQGSLLIIAPLAVSKTSWKDEIKKWGFPFKVKSLIVNEDDKALKPEERYKAYQDACENTAVYLINREKVTDLVDHLPKDPQNKKVIWPFPNVILDESHSFKNWKSERFKSLMEVRPQVDRIVMLTGTPNPNGLEDLWGQMKLLDNGARLGRTISIFHETYFNPGYTPKGRSYPVTWIPKPGAEDQIFKKINDIVMSARNKDLKLPDVTYTKILIKLSDDEMARYKKMMKNYVLDVDGDKVTAANAAVLQGKLSQMASGAIYMDSENKKYYTIHERKLDAIEQILSMCDGGVLVAYHYQSDKDMLLKRFPNAVVFNGSENMVHMWNDGQIPLLLMQPASGGYGLNLQDGGHTIIWYTLPWSLSDYTQMNARLVRPGQKELVNIYQLVAEGTVDEQILDALYHKDICLQSLIMAVDKTIHSEFSF